MCIQVSRKATSTCRIVTNFRFMTEQNTLWLRWGHKTLIRTISTPICWQLFPQNGKPIKPFYNIERGETSSLYRLHVRAYILHSVTRQKVTISVFKSFHSKKEIKRINSFCVLKYTVDIRSICKGINKPQ